MADCGRLFQQRQELLARERVLGDAANDLAIRASAPDWLSDPDKVPDARWKEANDAAHDYVNTPEAREAVQRGLDTPSTTHIGDGQPTNYRQLLEHIDRDTVESYATLHQLLMAGHRKVDPADYAFLTQTYGRDRVLDMVARAYEDMGINGADLSMLSRNVRPFLNLVENLTRLRIGMDRLRSTYLAQIGEAADAIDQGLPVTPQARQQLFKTWKWALVAQRHYDLARRRTGQALRSLQDLDPARLQDEATVDLVLGTGETPSTTWAPDTATIEEGLGTRPEDVKPGEHIGQVMEAIADAKGKPRRGAQKLRELKSTGALDGLQPRSRFKTDDDWINHNLLYANVLAKDSMLLQLRSHLVLNVPSNLLMSVYGPYRQAFENIGNVITYGHKLSRQGAMDAARIAWQSHSLAMQMTVANARSLYMDALTEGRAFYGSNQDLAQISAGKLLDADMNDVELARMRQVVDLEIPLDSISHAATKAAAQVLKVNAAFRLFLHDQFGLKGPLLQPGLRNMLAADNVGGYFFHTFKLLNDLNMEARFRADELGLDTVSKQQQWVNDRFEEAYIKIRPTEQEILSEGAELLSQGISRDEVAQMIADRRAEQFHGLGAGEYGVPRLDTDLQKEANRFSREMRFQNPPQSQPANALYGAAQGIRRQWWGDVAVPFFQAPFSGGLLDLALLGDPIAGTFRLFMWDKMSGRQRSKAMASWAVATTVLGLFLALDAADADQENLIVGNGPLDPTQREAWLRRLTSRGLAPNTVAGMPVAGLPILNTLMLWRDVKDSGAYAARSKMDNAFFMEAIVGTLTGHLMRMTGVQQLKRVMDLLMATGDRKGERAAALAGFQVGSFAIPGVGLVRQAGAMMGLNDRNAYRNRGPSQSEVEAGIDWNVWERVGEFAKNFAYAAAPPSQAMLGGVRQLKDHLGQPLRIPWGMPALQWMQDRFSPQDWPEGVRRTYAQLDLHGLLVPPKPLFTRELGGVRMNDELQEEYRVALSQNRGKPDALARANFMGLPMAVNFSGEVVQEIPGTGLRRTKGIGMANVPLHGLLQRHIVGKTRLEAFESLFNDPIYKRLMAEPSTTADLSVQDKTAASRRRSVATRLVNAVDAYYQMEAAASINLSPSPAAAEWRERRRKVDAQRSIQRTGETLQDAIRAINGPAE